MIISTSYAPDARVVEYAKALAHESEAIYVPRARYAIQQLQHLDAQQSLLLVTKSEIRYYYQNQKPLFFHPSLATIRIKRLLNGERDLLVAYTQASANDHVIDCTAGLCSDAIVLSYQVGAKGKVTALESEPILALMIREGLQSYRSDTYEINDAMRRIHVISMNHLDYLQQQASQSADIIYFDPMFRQPLHKSDAIQSIRDIANHSALTIEAIHQAKRVARKRIVMKEHRSSPEFERLGVTYIGKSNTQVTYGVIEL